MKWETAKANCAYMTQLGSERYMTNVANLIITADKTFARKDAEITRLKEELEMCKGNVIRLHEYLKADPEILGEHNINALILLSELINENGAASNDWVEISKLQNELIIFRRLLALNYSGIHLYGDDGELQDNRLPIMIDFVRDSAQEIEKKISDRAMLKYIDDNK